MKRIIDAHIHLDQYEKEDIVNIVSDSSVDALIAVSWDLDSCKRTRELAQQFPKVKPAYGYHPEQSVPAEKEIADLLSWMDHHQHEMIAVGEVGLPYYLRRKEDISLEPYIELLEQFIIRAKKWDKPIVLHAVYEDAPVVCSLLEKHSIEKAHFHWFKGDKKTVERMIRNGYYISVTPDVLYEMEIQKLVCQCPLDLLMAETDGPWPFEGPFSGRQTAPQMIHFSIGKIAELKKTRVEDIYSALYKNTLEIFSN
ncbi:TatD family hydrolase [Metabacillus fastidiosus]|uniref:TatD family hydrolase n=1 Tax=Metabacillus fastidiosus TaxID=1458 RepID=UPI0008262AF5|nr:TatD family hydrolase [Metabacillus fastidiosus]MED4461207.1 TatD family hydrolase [Metabacillus fastidiosus]